MQVTDRVMPFLSFPMSWLVCWVELFCNLANFEALLRAYRYLARRMSLEFQTEIFFFHLSACISFSDVGWDPRRIGIVKYVQHAEFHKKWKIY